MIAERHTQDWREKLDWQGQGSHLTRVARRSAISLRWAILLSLLLTTGGLWGCEKLASPFQRTLLPDMGPRLANSVKLTFDPSFTNLKMQYIDGCNSPHELNVGEEVESIMIDAASQNFTAVTVTGGVPAQISPDKEIVVTLQRSGLKLWADNVYDRVPADITLETLLTFKDTTGKELGRQTVSITHNQRLILEPSNRRCDYGNIQVQTLVYCRNRIGGCSVLG